MVVKSFGKFEIGQQHELIILSYICFDAFMTDVVESLESPLRFRKIAVQQSREPLHY